MKGDEHIFSKTLRKVIADQKMEGKKITLTQLAHGIGMSRQNFNNKLARDSFSCDEMIGIAKCLGMKLILKSVKDGTEYELKKGE